MYPILFRYGPFIFYTYSVVLGLGLLAAATLTIWRERQSTPTAPPHWLDGFLLSLFAALFGGRLLFVLMNQEAFAEPLRASFLVWRGGLSYHGALLAGLLALAFWCGRRGRSFYRYAAWLAPAAALWSAFGWLACWFEGCAYGRATFVGPLAADLPDAYGIYAVRYQTQLLGLFLSLLAFILLWRWRNVRPEHLFWLALLLISVGRLLVSLLRADPQPQLVGLRLDTVVEGLLALSAIMALAIYLLRQRPAVAG